MILLLEMLHRKYVQNKESLKIAFICLFAGGDLGGSDMTKELGIFDGKYYGDFAVTY